MEQEPEVLSLTAAKILRDAPDSIKVTLKITVADGYYIYGQQLSRRAGIMGLRLTLEEQPGVKLDGVDYPPPEAYNDPTIGQTMNIHKGTFDLSMRLKIDPAVPPKTCQLQLISQACGEGTCRPPATQQIQLQLQR